MIFMTEIKQEINFDDFMKLDIRIGTVISAELVPNSNKLIKIVFDFGDFQRQIVAGIATKYEPEFLISKQIPVIVNLASRQMMGLESQGMILAIGNKDVESLLMPCESVKAGASVH